MAVGTVKWFDNSRGFGLIQAESGADVFVHFSAIHGDGLRTLSPGEEVEFEIRDTERGLQAANVMRP
jgi:CspA family cold shock protein